MTDQDVPKRRRKQRSTLPREKRQRTDKDNSSPTKLFTWQLAVVRSNLLPTTKHVLLTLSVHMDWQNLTCFPSMELLDTETGRARSTLCIHLDLAVKNGFLLVEKNTGTGKGWHRNLYRARLPNDADFALKGGSATELPEVTEAVRLPTDGSSIDDKKAVRLSNTNATYNAAYNYAAPGARDLEAAPAAAQHGKRKPAKPASAIASPSVTPQDVRAWAAARNHVANQVGEASFKSWIAPLQLEVASPEIVLSAPTRFHRDHVISHFLVHLRDGLAAAFEDDRPLEWRVRRSYPQGLAPNPSTDDKGA